ncbi:hypothetical protein DBZ36_13860 [Alginatibacterium sediminis]|uniref:Transglycosylase SLT domain-containing protein n=1 Tax=Alginatibacterium sediminis TaxID=2164068 RepID=A0A420EA47_9ALTE|nr:hypothetical protein DBZ36_13860 [Alginatibacterium sediminis]
MFASALVLVLSACSSSPPASPENLCEIFKEKRDWHKSALKMNKKWGTPVHVPMAMMYQESSFKHNARPPMEYFLGVIPTGRASSAYGYSQAKTLTWGDYVKETGNRGASRSNFDDAIDFMGWFTDKSQKINGVSKWDARNQYLNYHEGWGGYKRKTYNSKAWLVKVAGTVDQRSKRYAAQYNQCKDELNRGWFSRTFFG